MIEFSPALNDIATAGGHRLGDDRAPKRYKDSAEAEFRGKAIETLSRLDWAYIGSMTADEWPWTSASRFVFTEAEGRRPILYFLMQPGSLPATHIAANPRIGIEAHLAVGWLERRKARAVQLQSLASFVSDDEEARRMCDAFAQKYANDPAFVRPDESEIVRAETLSIVNFYATARPQWGYIDFTTDT